MSVFKSENPEYLTSISAKTKIKKPIKKNIYFPKKIYFCFFSRDN